MNKRGYRFADLNCTYRVHSLGHHGHVYAHSVTLAHACPFQSVGDTRNLSESEVNAIEGKQKANEKRVRAETIRSRQHHQDSSLEKLMICVCERSIRHQAPVLQLSFKSIRNVISIKRNINEERRMRWANMWMEHERVRGGRKETREETRREIERRRCHTANASK